MFAVTFHNAGCIPDSDFWPCEGFDTVAEAWEFVRAEIEDFAEGWEDDYTDMVAGFNATDVLDTGILPAMGTYLWEVYEMTPEEVEEFEARSEL